MTIAIQLDSKELTLLINALCSMLGPGWRDHKLVKKLRQARDTAWGVEDKLKRANQ